MHITQLIAEIKPRLQRIGLVDPTTSFYDENEVFLYVQDAMRFLANRYQLQHFLSINRELFRTIDGVESYTIPPNYGFWAPEETRRSGLCITNTDGTGITNLLYYDPAKFNLLRTDTHGKPAWFTMADALIWFQPVPDAAYVIEAIVRHTQEGEDVPEPYVEAVKIQTLWGMAADQPSDERVARALPLLAEERMGILRTLVNNEARFRQRFYTSPERPGFGRGRRRYGM